MELRILGYYGGYPDNGVGTSGYLLTSNGYNLVMDLGSIFFFHFLVILYCWDIVLVIF